MPRVLFAILATLSLLLGIGASVLYFRSSHVCESLSWGKNGGSFWLMEDFDGLLDVSVYRNWFEDQPLTYRIGEKEEVAPAVLFADWGARSPSWNARVPLLGVAAVAGILPTLFIISIFLRRSKRRRTAANHLCPVCGYDLRATPDRCPECGMVPKRISSSN